MKKSAGILVYRKSNAYLEFLLVHPGGPFFKNKDLGAWSIPKGEFGDDEDPLTAAKREFYEETGFRINGDFIRLTPVKQKGGKMVYAWANLQEQIETAKVKSNLFTMEWPPRSGKRQEFPEIDRAGWFDETEAKIKILNSQLPLLIELSDLLNNQSQ